ncbi:MAG: hypothetical protein Q8P67_00935 [archaeon]|nr:hypothetical protein [archaeon]
MYASLRVFTPLEALKLVASSSRCAEELSDALISPSRFCTCLVVRPWVSIRPGFEFRVFVSNCSLTCGSQYENACYPEVWEARHLLQERISQFVREQVIPRLSHLPSYVCDVVLTDADRLFVCEINPFATTTSACLFSWANDKDALFIGPESWRFVPPSPSAAPKPIPEPWEALAHASIRQRRAYLFVNCAMYVFVFLACLAAVAVKHSGFFDHSVLGSER